MSSGVFHLDEDREREPSLSPTPSPSSRRPSPPQPSQPQPQSSTTTRAAGSPSPALQVPAAALPQPQPFGRKSAAFATTPSFSSPLAQAVTVASHTDSSSSSASSTECSPHPSDDESSIPSGTPAAVEGSPLAGLGRASATPEPPSSTSSRRSYSRPPSPSQARQPTTPGSLLMNRVRRSGSVSLNSSAAMTGAPFTRSSPPIASGIPKQEINPPGSRRVDMWSDVTSQRSHHSSMSGSSGRGTASETGGGGSSPLAFGSPELEPTVDLLSVPPPISVVSPTPSRSRDSNILGLGWASGWGASTPSSASKGKAKDSSRPASPKKDAEASVPVPSSPVTRPRRGSEYMRSSSVDLRKQQPLRLGYGPNGGSSSLSSSASLISPLDPLPSPWSETPGNMAGMAVEQGPGSSLSRSVTGASIRLNRVPTSVRLAADLIKTQSTPPPPHNSSDSSTSVPTPNPSPAETDKGISGLPSRKVALPASASLPPGALNAALSSSPSASTRWNSMDASTDASSLSSMSSPTSAPAQHASPSPVGASPIMPPSQGPRASTVEAMLSRRSSPVAVLSPSSAAGSSSLADDGSSTGVDSSPTNHLGGVGPSRLRAASEKGGLTMDLAGVSAIGDAASHANLIMQSRHAKVQRWRPRGVGSPESEVPPLLTPGGSPVNRLSASYVEGAGSHFGHWESARKWIADSPGTRNRAFADQREMPQSPASHLGVDSVQPKFGSVRMEKQVSATGSVASIEWVDWYDEYKAYKAEKIRAEAQAASDRQDSQPVSPIVGPSHVGDSEYLKAPSASTATLLATTEPAALASHTPTDDTAHPQDLGVHRKRSMSLRSAISAMDQKRSPNPKRSGFLERPRQSSGGSMRSASGDTHLSLRRKKNLVSKMEGWWNAVKSNFSADAEVDTRPPAASVYSHPRVPSAPQSRRGSDKSSSTFLGSSLHPPEPVRRSSSTSMRSVRPSTSHMDLPRGETKSVGGGLMSGSAGGIEPVVPVTPLAEPAPAVVHKAGEIKQIQRHAVGLEARRNQPSLRLDLEPNTLTLTSSRHRRSSCMSGSNDSRGSTMISGSAALSQNANSRSSSYGFGQSLGTSSQWDQTPSPLLPIVTARETRDDKPVAPGADLTVASVRRHVKQRLNAAKEQCDSTLKRIIGTITIYVDQRMAATEDIEDPRQDYFDTFADSPSLDPADSEDDWNIPPIGGNVPSRGSSRRGSMTMSASASAIISSPSRRMNALSSVPSSPRKSMSRRRPSIVRRRDHRGLSADQPSASSSRSTSRSRSPMPQMRGSVHAHQGFDSAIDTDRLFLTSLQDLIVLATDVLDLTVDSLISRPSACVELVRKIQGTGQAWDEHEDWPGRAWYVDILMAVARLARVLEWWEAEKGFWNFDEDADEPLSLLLRPTRDIPQFELEPGRADLEPSQAISSPALSAEQDLSQSATTITLPRSQLSDSPKVSAADAKDQYSPDNAAQAIEDLRILAQEAQNVNIVMELSLQGEEIIYVNDAIYEVIGREPEDLFDRPISELLAPADTSHFSEATEQLLEDDSNTVELRFRLEAHKVEGSPDEREPGPSYMELEGVGMLIRENNEPSHTMWVMKPVTATQVENITDAVFPRDGVISTESVLCRICEREIVVWFFEKHNETCDAVHRLDAEIDQANECLCELVRTVNKLKADLTANGPRPASPVRPIVFYQIPESISNDSEPDPQGVDGSKVDIAQLQTVINILTTAKTIETPSVLENEVDMPFNLQRYISAESEEKLLRITRWQKPPTTDSGLARLFTLIEEQLRHKQKAVARMQSTIRYSEKIRHEWEDKINQMVTDSEDASGSDSSSDGLDASAGSAEVSATSPQEAFGLRAPAVRLPITQGHPQRAVQDTPTPKLPRTDTGMALQATLGVSQVEAHAASVGESCVSTTEEPSTPQHVSNLTRLRGEGLSGSPDASRSRSRPLERGEHRGHTRRVSSVKAIRDGPISPFLSTSGSAIATKAPAPSIKDFEIIKPISRGAFGSVYLAKKVATGDYYAIKTLKKSDMIAKNQITNVKAERTILMNQASSPYVVKLYFSFQSKDYLYLVMEYLNGGDCATLVKTLGALPLDWARNYIGELVLGLEYLHGRNVAHRDIKPDNMLIDSRGHLKLTDFGLSKMGLLNRQIGGPRAPYLQGTSLRTVVTTRSSMSSNDSPLLSPETVPVPSTSQSGVSYFPQLADSPSAEDSSGSESNGPIPRHMRHRSSAKGSSDAGTNSGAEPPRFVGTPDYLAPESILGGSTDDRMVDWWAVGVVLYEFLYGVPPFHADSPEKVFDNVVSRRINWDDDEVDIPPDARDLMDRLMCSNPSQRLGARGADEVKRHIFFEGIDFDTLTSTEAVFVPNAADPESTDYFDPRGANTLPDEDDGAILPPLATPPASGHTPNSDPALAAEQPEPSNDFGAFNFKNLPVLKQANDDVIRRIRSDSIAAHGHPAEVKDRLRSHPVHRKASTRGRGPPSPSTSTSSAASTPSRAAASPVTPSSFGNSFHIRRPSELNALERVKLMDHDSLRHHPSNRFRAGSGSSASDRSSNIEAWAAHSRRPTAEEGQLVPAANSSHPAGKSLVVLVAEDNPISQMVLETLLSRLGCRCVCVQDGPEALAAAMGSIKFDIIFCDMNMPFVNGEQVARMLRSTTNTNQNTPIIAATAYDEAISEQGTVFSAILPKPFSKVELLQCLGKVGFSLSCTAEHSVIAV